MKTSQVMNILRHTVNLMFASETHTALVTAELITGFEVHWWWAFRFPFFNSGPYCFLSAFLLSIACRYPSSSNTKYLNTQLLVIRCIMDLFLKGSAWKALKLRLQAPAIQRDDHLVNYGEQIIEQCRSWSYSPTSGLHKPARLKSPVYLCLSFFFHWPAAGYCTTQKQFTCDSSSLLLRTQSFFRCRENFNPKTNYIKSVS